MLGMRALLVVVLLSCGGRQIPPTLADGCFNVGSALCDREQDCGTLRGSLGGCRSDFVTACCAGVDCSRPVAMCSSGVTSCCASAKCDVVAVDVGVFDRCENGVRQLSCGQLAAGLVPGGCAAVADAGS
jgi:hypothetical protein